MRTRTFITAIALALAASGGPALAQSVGGASGGGISGGGASSGGTSSPSLGGASNTLGSGGGVGSSATSTQERATAGSSTINSVNADAVARSGDVGAATTIGGTDGTGAGTGTGTGSFQSTAGAGSSALYNIPQARVNVDLAGIRAALRMGPNATPDAHGN